MNNNLDPSPGSSEGSSESDSNTGVGNQIQERSIREKRKPGWMADYTTWEGSSEEEDGPMHALMMMLMVAENDPIMFEEAV